MDAQPHPQHDGSDRPAPIHTPSSLMRRALADRRWHPVVPWRATEDPCAPLQGALRSWPARWRYRVAALEATGMSRATAVEVVLREATDHAPHAV